MPAPSEVAATKKSSPQEKIYDSLSRRLEPFTRKMSLEDQAEVDGVIQQFSEDVTNAVHTVTFFRNLQ